MTIWFTADTHFRHTNVIKHSNRPFESVEDMDRELIKRWNSRIKPKDSVYHLGDIVWGLRSSSNSILNQLNGNIHLIKGNHDKSVNTCKDRFVWVKDIHRIKVPDVDAPDGKQRHIVLCHYAMRVWDMSHYGAWHLYGHSHGELPDLKTSLSLDVGVDCHNYYPISYEQVKEWMSKKQPATVLGKRRQEMSITDTCPECSEQHLVRARCPNLESRCNNGHTWHWCTACRETVRGEPHRLAGVECTCKGS